MPCVISLSKTKKTRNFFETRIGQAVFHDINNYLYTGSILSVVTKVTDWNEAEDNQYLLE